ncbi:MAG: hypothetical protein II713_02475, partial [Clostridia bacterium]|nr:hypothetical protein [Clostridia bacterium]
VGQYLEQHPRVGDGISSFRRERAVQSPVIQLLKLRVCQPNGCILRYYFFCIQSNFQLTISLNYVILCCGNVLCHDLILPQTETPANPFSGKAGAFVFSGAILQRAPLAVIKTIRSTVGEIKTGKSLSKCNPALLGIWLLFIYHCRKTAIAIRKYGEYKLAYANSD